MGKMVETWSALRGALLRFGAHRAAARFYSIRRRVELSTKRAWVRDAVGNGVARASSAMVGRGAFCGLDKGTFFARGHWMAAHLLGCPETDEL